jgi:hypothetical protein
VIKLYDLIFITHSILFSNQFKQLILTDNVFDIKCLLTKNAVYMFSPITSFDSFKQFLKSHLRYRVLSDNKQDNVRYYSIDDDYKAFTTTTFKINTTDEYLLYVITNASLIYWLHVYCLS